MAEARAGEMPESAPHTLSKILEAEEFARHRKMTFWEEVQAELWNYLMSAYQSFTDWLRVSRTSFEGWVPAWLLDLGTFIESVLLAAFRGAAWLLSILYYPSLILLLALGLGLISRSLRGRRKGEGALRPDPTPASESLDLLRARGDSLALLEALRRQIRSSLGRPTSTDRELLRTVNPSPLAQAVFEYFEKVAYAGEGATESVVFGLYDRYLQGGR